MDINNDPLGLWSQPIDTTAAINLYKSRGYRQLTPEEARAYRYPGRAGGLPLPAGMQVVPEVDGTFWLAPSADVDAWQTPDDNSDFGFSDIASAFNDMKGWPVLAAPIAVSGAQSLLGGAGNGLSAELAAGAPEGLSAGTGAGEPGMWEWLDDYAGGDWGGGETLMPPAVPETPETLQGWGMSETSPGVWEQPPLSSGFSVPSWLSSAGSFAKNLLGGGTSILNNLAPTGAGSTGGGILDQILGNPLQSAFNMTPFLLALNEAKNQSGDLNNVIGKINGEGYQRAVLNPYDLDTGLGRTKLLEDMNLRGVSGSSFGYQNLGNYDYLRALGRGDLASKANLASAGLEGNLVNMRNTNRNLLLGAGLNASGKMFAPQQDPFNLRALLGVP